MGKLNIYLESGYLDIMKLVNMKLPFTFVVGGRGTGKTYGVLKTLVENNIKFMYMRRTQAQIDIIRTPEFSPFKKLNEDLGWDLDFAPITKYNSGIYHCNTVDGKKVCNGAPIGYSCALSTFSNIRGFDASDVQVIFYDEFIPEKHERPIKNEATAFFNAYETVNRNRELNGEPPVQVLAMANSNDLANPIFLELGLVQKALNMYKRGYEVSRMEQRGILLCILQESRISVQKGSTALYRLTAGSDFSRMSLDNEFSGEEIGNIKSHNIKEFNPVVKVGEITVYKHKSKGFYYVSTHTTGSPVVFTSGDIDLKRFVKKYLWLWREYMNNNIWFEEYLCEILFTKYFN